jgi:hypothetical protein
MELIPKEGSCEEVEIHNAVSGNSAGHSLRETESQSCDTLPFHPHPPTPATL